MKYGNILISLNLDGNRLRMKRNHENKCFLKNIYTDKSILLPFIIVGIITLLFTNSLYGQSSRFVVQPGQFELITKPREAVITELKIHNNDPESNVFLEIKVLELSQDQDGRWLPIDLDPNNPLDYYEGMDVSKLSSCKSWVKLEKPEVTIIPNGDVSIGITINVPARVETGFYGAIIMVSTIAAKRTTELSPDIIVRTGVPVLMDVQRRPIPSDIEILDAGLEFIPAEGENPGTTFVSMNVKNVGDTFAFLWPVVRIRGYLAGRWRVISTLEFDEIGIIPGVELNLKSDVGKSLTSGTYRIDGALYVDGRLAERSGKEIDYVGDPLITKTSVDVPLDLNPRDVVISTIPGARRSEIVQVHNGSEETITVYPTLGIPEAFDGKAIDTEPVGKALSCIDWLEIEPEVLTLDGFGTRNLRIISRMPEDATQFPSYYSSLALKCVYPDKQSAGTSYMNICVTNQNASYEPQVECVVIDLEENVAEKSEYWIQAGFVNGGLVHVDPGRCRAAAVLGDGFSRAAASLNCNKTGMLLPYESRTYTGVLDCSGLDPIQYGLVAKLDFPPSLSAKKQVSMKITEEGGRKIPQIVNQRPRENEIFEINW